MPGLHQDWDDAQRLAVWGGHVVPLDLGCEGEGLCAEVGRSQQC